MLLLPSQRWVEVCRAEDVLPPLVSATARNDFMLTELVRVTYARDYVQVGPGCSLSRTGVLKSSTGVRPNMVENSRWVSSDRLLACFSDVRWVSTSLICEAPHAAPSQIP